MPPLDYDIEKDLRFKQGIEKGKTEQAILSIKRMHQKGISPEEIADFLGLSIDFVKQVIQEMKS